MALVTGVLTNTHILTVTDGTNWDLIDAWLTAASAAALLSHRIASWTGDKPSLTFEFVVSTQNITMNTSIPILTV